MAKYGTKLFENNRVGNLLLQQDWIGNKSSYFVLQDSGDSSSAEEEESVSTTNNKDNSDNEDNESIASDVPDNTSEVSEAGNGDTSNSF